jgi:hypothetical protein
MTALSIPQDLKADLSAAGSWSIEGIAGASQAMQADVATFSQSKDRVTTMQAAQSEGVNFGAIKNLEMVTVSGTGGPVLDDKAMNTNVAQQSGMVKGN